MSESSMPPFEDRAAMAEWYRQGLMKGHESYLAYLREFLTKEQMAAQLAAFKAALPRELADKA